ncbi:hypothetical protein [Leisingera sp. ANG-Vp]|uniref:hypothetical protein n=1 Tax=Leisingera sp. ANG-Vp TaxID=1577896 RepID=UPI00068FC78C|nr:hypothetical protein [Leisingera sp. ANG-Vp]
MTDILIPAGTRIAAFDATAAMQAIGAGGSTGAALDFTEGSRLSTSGHKVYNFEVAGTHTYIADGIRVHNKSVLSFLTPGETIVPGSWKDTDGDGDWDYYLAIVDDGFGIVEVVSQNGENEDTTIVTKDYVYTRDGKRIQLVQEDTIVRNPETGDEVVTSVLTHADLDGMRFGEQTAQALTPFLARALIGDDAGFLETVAVDTILDTVLGNLGEAGGGILHHSFLEADTNGTVIERLTEISFEDFGSELVLNGVNSTVSVINSLIMAEIFESVEVDGVPGAIFEAATSAGLNVLLSNGADKLLESLFGHLPADSFWGGISQSYSGATLPDPLTLVVNAVINEILPDLETFEGALASAGTTALTTAYLMATFEKMATYVAGPIGAVVGLLVGKVFDFLFDKDPQAWTNVGFDEETGRFKVLDTWQDDGGNVELSRSLAETYVEGMNGFIDAVKAQSHNFDDLGQWSFGHYESALKNAGAGGQTFADFQATYINAYVNDLADVQLQDGQRTAVRALEAIEVERLMHEFQNFGKYKGVLDAVAAMEEPGAGTFTLTREPGMPDHPAYGLTFSWSADQNFSQRFEAFLDAAVRQAYATLKAQFTTKERDLPPATDWNGLVAAMQEALPFFEIAERPTKIHYGDKVDRVVTVSWEEFLEPKVKVEKDYWVTTYEPQKMIGSVSPITGQQDILDQFGIEEALFFTEAQIYQLINSNLQIATDYHSYLENTEEVNTLITTAPNSTLTAGWIATLTAAEEMGLNDRYNLTGDGIDNVFYTADGNDVIRGESGHDLIKTYGGNDKIYGGTEYDTIHAGSGNDTVWGDNGRDVIYLEEGDDVFHDNDQNDTHGRDIVYGGGGEDTLNGGGGNDTLHGGGGADSIVGGIGHDEINGGTEYDTIQAGDGNDTVWGGNGRDSIGLGDGDDIFWDNDQKGEAGRDTVNGGNGKDVLNGAGGADELYGGSGEDTVIGGAGNDALYGGGQDDELYGGSGDDTHKAGDGNDLLRDDGGKDSFDGGSGEDTVSYFGHGAGMTVNLDTGANSGGDTYVSIEHLEGSDLAADYLTGNSAGNWLNGQSGSDTLAGLAGQDTLRGEQGNDKLYGGDDYDRLYGDEGRDTLKGGNGNDFLQGGAGADSLDGGSGHDRANYANSAAAISINLETGTFAGGDAEGDTLTSIEEIHGSAFGDTLTGGTGNIKLHGHDGNDRLQGKDGADKLFGGADKDTLHGGAGNDSLEGNDGDDRLYGNSGDDTLLGGDGDDYLRDDGGIDVFDGGEGSDTVSYYGHGEGVTVNLNDGSNSSGDSYTSIENVLGSSNFADSLTGSSDANRLKGSGGDDTLHGLGGTDTLEGGSGDDRLYGGSGSDTLLGGDGNDYLRDENGQDSFDGGDGEDTVSYYGDSSGVTVNLATGANNDGDSYSSIEHLMGSNKAADDLTGDAGANRLQGLIGNDTLRGGDGNDTLQGGDGNDILSGERGDDLLEGGAGNDTLHASASGENDYGKDTLDGGAGDDVLYGANSKQLLAGGDGNDTLYGGNDYGSADKDTLKGGAGNDLLESGQTRATDASHQANGDQLYGEDGDDTLNGGTADDRLDGGEGKDRLYGFEGSDTLLGGGGNDYLQGGAGADTLDGGSGYDRVSYAASAAGVVVDLTLGTGSGGDAQNDTLISIEEAYGSDFNDTLTGNSANNKLHGLDGKDKFYGKDGNDTINGGGGNDTLYGDGGNDSLNAGDGDDFLRGGTGADTLDGGSGRDRVNYQSSSAGVTVSLITGTGSGGEAEGDVLSNIERIWGSDHGDTLTGDGGANDLYGLRGDDRLVGDAGNDALYGGDGDDTLIGGIGADSLYGGSGIDLVSYEFAGTAVTVDLENNASNSGQADGDVLTGIENLKGSSKADVLEGDSAANFIWGSQGADSIRGESGNDTLYGGSQSDTVDGGTGNDSLRGDAGNDLLEGRGGQDTLDGGTHADTLRGGVGNDTLIGGGGSDTFVFERNFDHDRISDFADDSDMIELRGMGFANVSDALSNASETGGNVVFDFGNGDKLTVLNTSISSLQDDIILT